MSDFSASIRAILDTSQIPKGIKEIEKQQVMFSNFTVNAKTLASQIQTALNGHSFMINVAGVNTNNIKNQMQTAGNQAGQAFSQSLVGRINSQISSGGIDASIMRVTAQYERLGSTGHAKLSQIRFDLNELTRLQTAMGSSQSDQALVANYERFNATLLKVRNNLSIVATESRATVSSLQITTLDSKIALWMEKNSRASKDFGASIQALRSRLAELNASGNATKQQLNQVEQEFRQIKVEATSAGKVGASFGSTLKGAFTSISRYISVSTLIYQSIYALRQMYQNVYDIDTEMTELKKVTDETAESYSNFLDKAGTSAKEIGTTIKGLVSSTADFARLGYGFEDAQGLAEVANIYAVVGDEVEGVDGATQSLISTMAAFKDEASNMSNSDFAMSVIDRFNEIGNNFAISSGGIGDALQRSASSLDAANNTIDESIALITAANTVVQNPETVGRLMPTLKVAISVKLQRWTRPRKDFISFF